MVERGATGAALRRRHLIMARVLLGMIGLQIALAMVGIPLLVHGALGLLVWLLALAVAVVAARGQIARFTVTLSIAVVALATLQGLLIAGAHWIDLLGSVHSVNAFVVLAASLALAIEAEDEDMPDTEDARV